MSRQVTPEPDTTDPGKPVARKRNRRGEGGRLRTELVAAASRLLETVDSEDGLSLRAVAREVGVSAPSVYLQFADKEKLMWAVLEERFIELRDVIEEAASAADGPAEELRARCVAYCMFGLEQPGNYRVLFSAVSTYKPDVALDQLPGADVFFGLVGAVMRCVEAGVARRLDPFLAGTVLWSTLHGMVMLRISKPVFPWPSIETLIRHLLVEQIGLSFDGTEEEVS
ncbi:TetR/AcrR family transcriptional regulator [Solihabitans fulvus]|uniref:TetR/AcrR family transcriptional regulator n=1 Tax=Solihabitans fulvus TaxID=1892852 RepID=UPI0016620E80|nr:TetR/AcrR family transcriptional regulator [Solihabitans fulvus]